MHGGKLTNYRNWKTEQKSIIQEQQQKGVQCDGLVISGHHVGSFSGSRDSTHKGLSIAKLEEMACQPEYAEWFP